MTATINTMYDTITLSTIPPNPPALAGYVGGFWPTYSPECQAYPTLFKLHRILSIAVNASEDAECLDCESGDAVPAQVPGWLKRQITRGVKRPVVYASVSAVPEILSLCFAAGLKRSDFRVWSAHYTGRPHLCSAVCGFGQLQADATQFTDHAWGRNLDQSFLSPSFFSTVPAPPVKNPIHYDWYDNRRRAIVAGRTEQGIVRSYDKYRAKQTPKFHPDRAILYLLRAQLSTLERRTRTVAEKNPVNGKPSWGVEHRGWRRINLARRRDGHRIA